MTDQTGSEILLDRIVPAGKPWSGIVQKGQILRIIEPEKYGLDIKQVIKPVDAQTPCDLGKEAFVEKGILVNSGQFDGINNREAMAKIAEWMEKEGIGSQPARLIVLHHLDIDIGRRTDGADNLGFFCQLQGRCHFACAIRVHAGMSGWQLLCGGNGSERNGQREREQARQDFHEWNSF